MKAKVSIIVPVYDGLSHLKDTLDSVIAQTYDNIEIIVVDNGLNDSGVVEQIIESYGDNITLLRKANSSLAEALNYGVKKSTGQYFSWLSQGDTYEADRVEQLVKQTTKANIEIVASSWTVVNQNGRTVHTCSVDARLEQHPGCYMAFATETRLNTCSMLIPTEMFNNNGQFDNSLSPYQDYGMLSRLVSAGANFKVCSQSLLNYKAHLKQELLTGSMAEYSYDFLHSEVINSLSYDDIIGYFGSREEAVTSYKQILDAGFPRIAAFLMERIIQGSIAHDGRDVAKGILLDDLSGLSEHQMATDASTLISKFAKPTNKKKIMFSSAHWLTGGMERVMSTLFRELKNDYEIFLITPYDARKSHIDVPDYVTSIKIADDLFVKHFDSLILAYALLLDIDVAIGFINLFDKQQNFYNLCVGTKIKTIASNHEYYFYPYKSPTHYDVVEKRLDAFRNCDAILWANNFNAALCGMYVQNNYVISNPNNFEISQKVDEAPRGKTIICVGRFNDYVKRIDRILECFSLVLKDVPDAKLVLVGKYDNNAPIRPNDNMTVNDLINNLAMPSDSLSFVGEVSNVQDYYNKARVLLFTSNSEGFGMVLNEAACFGVPSVSNYMPGVEDIIKDGENGYITEQGDIRSMASRVRDILNDNKLHKRLSDNAKKRVEAYDSNHIGNKWRYLIRSLIEIGDKKELHKTLNSEFGYSIQNQELFSKVLSNELNEIFFMAINECDQRRVTSGIPLLLSKVATIPKRLRANIEYEGWFNTSSKIITRSFRIIRNRLKI